MTVLGAGPMSRTFTEIVIDEANRLAKPILLIPSRRQVDSEAEGGGYVENWTSSEFCRFVRKRDVGSFVVLARDHSGPWQGHPPIGATLESEWERTAASLEDDVRSGFDIIHCDPSPALQHGASESDVINLAVSMAIRVQDLSDLVGREVGIEVGTDEQVQGVHSLSKTFERAREVSKAFRDNKLALPLYYVAQTGTKVSGTRNCGVVASGLVPKRKIHPYAVLESTAKGLESIGMGLKVHNGDYLSTEVLRWHRRLGLHAMNVAPEYGVTEARFLVSLAERLGLREPLDLWRIEVWEGAQWKRWAEPSESVNAPRAVELAGHYHFATEKGVHLREEIVRALRSKGEDFDTQLRDVLLRSLRRYTTAFGY